LRVAFDPRVPAAQQALEFQLDRPVSSAVDWYVDGRLLARTETPTWLWPLSRGEHRASARAVDDSWGTPSVRFLVR
jgi:penicillin-binding protein 1C